VAASDEVWRLQRGDDPESRFFQKMAHQGHYGSGRGTKQGIYICAPSGKFLASANSLNAEKIRDMMDRALSAWGELSAAERFLPDDAEIEPVGRWESMRPKDGMTLRSYARDLPAGSGPFGAEASGYNKDHAWFSADEARRWLPETLEVGAEYELPQDLLDRMLCFHFVDSVLGQTLPYATSEVRGAINLRITEVDGDRCRIQISGRSLAESDGIWKLGENDWKPKRGIYPRGFRSRIVGEAVFDSSQSRFTSFELLVMAQRWGHTRFNGRSRQQEASDMAILFELAGELPADRVPPAFIDIYGAPWMER
jgi:hypothetical protein